MMMYKSIAHYILATHAGKVSNLLDYDLIFNLILKLITNTHAVPNDIQNN